MNRHLNADGTVRSTNELVAVIMEYEHALLHVTQSHDTTCVDCQRVAQGALDGVNADDFLDIACDESTNLVGEEHVHDHSVPYRGYLMCADDYCASLLTVDGQELSEDQHNSVLRQLQAQYSVPDDQTLACGRGEHDACEQTGVPGCACNCHNT